MLIKNDNTGFIFNELLLLTTLASLRIEPKDTSDKIKIYRKKLWITMLGDRLWRNLSEIADDLIFLRPFSKYFIHKTRTNTSYGGTTMKCLWFTFAIWCVCIFSKSALFVLIQIQELHQKWRYFQSLSWYANTLVAHPLSLDHPSFSINGTKNSNKNSWTNRQIQPFNKASKRLFHVSHPIRLQAAKEMLCR